MTAYGIVTPLLIERQMSKDCTDGALSSSTFLDVIAFTAADPQNSKARKDEAAALRTLFKRLDLDPANPGWGPVTRPSSKNCCATCPRR